MNSVYCWFDWDDNTTTVNSMNIIKEPRKPWTDYEKGEKVTAKLPGFGLWDGVIVEISESRKDLLQKMEQRQKNAAAALLDLSDAEIQEDNGDELPSVTHTGEDKHPTVKRTEATKGKRKDASKKRANEDSSSKAEEKKKKKMDQEVKLNAKNRQLEEIIRDRRKTEEKKAAEEVEEKEEEIQTTLLPLPSNTDIQEDACTYTEEHAPRYPNWQGNPFNSPYNSAYSAFQNYSYYGDLMSPSTSTATFQPLSSQTELQDRCARLELENDRLKEENKQLKEAIRRNNQDKTEDDVVATPKKVEFLRQLVSSFETHNARRINLLNTHMHNKKVTEEGKQKIWEARFKKRSSEQAQREHEDSLKFFQKMVSKGEETEQNLYSKVRAAEYSRQKQEQSVRRLQGQLQEVRRKNAASVKTELATRNRQEMELEQQLVREKAELDKVHSEREDSYYKLQAHRQLLGTDKQNLGRHETEHLRLAQVHAQREESYVKLQQHRQNLRSDKHHLDRHETEHIRLQQIAVKSAIGVETL